MRRICVVTGSRAEYGQLSTLLREMRADDAFDVRLVVTGTHLAPQFGLTRDEIERDGMPIAAEVDMLLAGDSPVAIAKSVGLGVIGFADAFARLAPEIVVLAGDRYETLAAAQAAMMLRLPIAHIAGGETTEGAMDEAIRHAITKMAQLHFVAAEPYARRVVQLGEAPERVFIVGALGVDGVRQVEPADEATIADALGRKLHHPLFLVTYHPVTLADDPAGGVHELIAALSAFPDAMTVVTGVNADSGNAAIARAFAAYADRCAGRVVLRASLGHRLYLSVMRHADAVIGNTSSGLVEAPAVGVPTVNIGNRQAGRLRGASVIDCIAERAAIRAAIERALSPAHRAATRSQASSHGDGSAAGRIKDVLGSVDLKGILIKRFHDLPATSAP